MCGKLHLDVAVNNSLGEGSQAVQYNNQWESRRLPRSKMEILGSLEESDMMGAANSVVGCCEPLNVDDFVADGISKAVT